MNLGITAMAMVCMLAQPIQQSTAPTINPTYPMRTSFVSAAEAVIDIAGSIDPKEDNEASVLKMQQLKTAKDNLNAMAEDDREKDVVTAANDLVFALTACHLQARGNASTEKCEAQVQSARTRTMETLGKHKNGNTWMDGPPSRP